MFGKEAVVKNGATLLAEFLGTGALTYIFLRMQHSSIGVAYFIAVAVGLALAAASFAFVGRSGAHLNPAVTIGMWTARQIKTVPAVLYIVTQCFGAWVAYVLFHYLFTQPVAALYQSQPAWDTRTFTAEALGALVFSLGWAAALHRARNNHAAFAGYVGLAFTVGILIASVASFGIVNPAAAVGSRVFHIWSGAAWGTYVLGPVVGAIVGFNVYQYLFAHDKVSLPASASASRATSSKKTSTKRATSKKR